MFSWASLIAEVDVLVEDETQREVVIDCLKRRTARSGWEDLLGFER